MAHFVRLENNIVTASIVISDEDCGRLEFPDSEPLGQQAIANYGIEGHWIQTSYNTRHGHHQLGRGFRKNYAGIGWAYDPVRDAFIPPQPFPSWTLNEQTCDWDPPVPYPEVIPGDGQHIDWNEETQTWDIIQIGT